MNAFISLIVAGLIGAAAIFFYIQPWRTVANFCNTYHAGKKEFLQKYAQQKNYGDDDFSQLLGSLTSIAGWPTDVANFFDKLEGVAPKDIQPDVATIRDAFKKQGDIMDNQAGSMASGNVLGGALSGIGSALMLGLRSQGAFNRVNDYIKNNCESELYLQNK